MQRSLWASLRSIGSTKRGSLISSALNSTRTDLVANCRHFKMHRGGVRNKSEFSRGGGGRRGGHGRHPSGLSGKQIGLWYAAKGKRNKTEREMKQRAYVTMDSHHEERINELLDNIRADESHNLNDGSGYAGSSNQNKEMNPGYRRKDDGPSASRGWYDASEKWSLTDRKDEMSSGSVRAEAGPSTARDWHDTSPQWMYQKDELSLDEDSGHTKSTAAFEKQFTVEADEPIIPDDLFASGGGRFNEASSSERSLQRDAVLDQCLREEQQRKLLSGGGRYQAMQEFRKRLPAYDKKEVLLLIYMEWFN